MIYKRYLLIVLCGIVFLLMLSSFSCSKHSEVAELEFNGITLCVGMNMKEVEQKIEDKVDYCTLKRGGITFFTRPFGLIAKVDCGFDQKGMLWSMHCVLDYSSYSRAEFLDKLQGAIGTLEKKYGEPTKQLGSFGINRVPRYIGWKLNNGNEIEYKYDDILGYPRYRLILRDGKFLPSPQLSSDTDYDLSLKDLANIPSGNIKKIQSDKFLRVGSSYVEKKNYDRAIEYFTKAIELTPYGAQLYFLRGSAWLMNKQYDNAIRDFDKVIESESGSAETYSLRGICHVSKGDYREAISDLTKAIQLELNKEVAHIIWDALGKAYYGEKRYEEALRWFSKAIQVKPDYASAWFNAACIYSLNGDKTNCLKYLSKAIDIDPTYKEKAKSEDDFKKMCNDEDFKKLVK